MSHAFYVTATEADAGKALVVLGATEFALRKTTRVGFFRPVIPEADGPDEDIRLVLDHFALPQRYEDSYALTYREAQTLLSENRADELLERIIAAYKKLEAGCDVIVCMGTDYLGEMASLEFELNGEIARNLGAPVLMIAGAQGKTLDEAVHPLAIAVDACRERGGRVAGVFLNKADPADLAAYRQALVGHFGDKVGLKAVIPFDARLGSPTVREIADRLGAEILSGGERLDGLVSGYLVAAMQLQHALTWLQEGQLVITPGDRGDIIIGMLQADRSVRYPSLAGLLLSGGQRPEPSILDLIEGSSDSLPILAVATDTYTTATRALQVKSKLRAGDRGKIERSITAFNDHVDAESLESQVRNLRFDGLTPRMFTYNLMQRAKADKRHIVLPEPTDSRVLRASAFLLERDAVRLTLLGSRQEVENALRRHAIVLDPAVLDIVDPATDARRESYAETYFQLRRHKGMTLDAARDCLLDVSYFGTMMVYRGDADGMVSGAIHTTQHTVLPALQIIKTRPGCSIVSSVFFMCLDSGVVVYGDCAVNPNPNAEQLAEIAISSADTAKAFGIEPRVALLSYSSGDSGHGEDVERVREATRIARQRRPDLLLEGPIQYDAAADAGVAAQKMPGSPVAGRATVFVFPDLNTGNNTYKAVQRETGALAIGPILQGLAKPVNDLSRGCTVADIVNTVVITAIQAQGATAAEER
ncbi:MULTISPECIES: phosphate acetyltransferase [Methylococcus]|uniref:Phosphate acetyltransferase n=1 Tax=Methylococcus capsulatus TaxID=414 RepID=A0ABZ2F556_METCP|nr:MULTISPECIES: phosphate acetyltransferase [Methylococcus]MDF9391548.1 phosphate acetyltransferase [Methylococcus capsulatus]